MKSRNLGLIAVAATPAIVIGGLLWWAGGLMPDCTNTVLSTQASPDTSKALVVFIRDCGAGGSNTQAAITATDAPLDAEASAFLALEGSDTLTARWDAYGNIEVTIPPGADVVRQRDEAAGVTIIYR